MTAETDRPDFKSSVDLALEADFALGASRVSPSTREVLRGTEREVLEPRVMQVLVALFQAVGRVVSRDELIARCWEGRIVGEDAINRAIGRLRRLSEVDREASFVVETIPRVGYRLVPASSGHVSPPIVAEIGSPEPAAQSDKAPPAVTGAQPHRWLIAGALILVGLVGFAAAWLLWPVRRWTVESSRPFTSTVAQEAEPAFSPDGKMLAYASGKDTVSHKIYVRNLAGGDGIKITADADDDVSPSWSSDGARIAYVAQKTGEPCRIMVVTVPAGEAREAGRCNQAETSSVTWQPGTQFLYYTDQSKTAGSVIVRLDLGTGARLQIVALNQAGTTLGQLRCSPDGKSLLYIRQQYAASEPIMVRDLASGMEKNVGETGATTGSNGSAAWSEDSQTVLVTIPSGIGSKIIAYPVEGGAAYSVYATATIASHLALGGGLLALETDSRRANLARASMAPAARPDIIDPANGITSTPTFAPDGTLAFISNRSGTNAVWTMKPGAVPTVLFDFGLRRIAFASFSPDGTRLAVGVASVAPGTFMPDPKTGGTFKILTPDGANVASFDVPTVGAASPTWTPDSKGLVVGDRRAQQAIRIAIDNPSQRAPVAAAGWVGVAMHGDAIFAIRSDKPGLWRIDKTPKLINAKYPAGGPTLAFRGDEVLIPDFAAEGGPRILAQPLAGGPDRVLAYAPEIQGRVAVDPRTGEMIYAVIFHNNNIELLTLAKH